MWPKLRELRQSAKVPVMCVWMIALLGAKKFSLELMDGFVPLNLSPPPPGLS